MRMGFLDDIGSAFSDAFGGGKPQEQPKSLYDMIFPSSPPPTTPPQQSSFFDGLFGGSTYDQPSTPPYIGTGSQRTILPSFTQASGYGGQPYGTQEEADKSCLMDGEVVDPATGYVGTPAQIYDRYRRERRDTTDLMRRFRRR